MPGSIVEVSLDGRSFKAAADGDGSTNLGGESVEFLANGDGETGRFQITKRGWMFSGISIAVDDENDDHEFLKSFKSRAARVPQGRGLPIKVVYADGTVRSGGGSITGDVEVSSMTGTADITLEGAGEFAKQ